ncbi:retropepsin-like aspartic protease [Aurantiacibacter suaedae]|uniref:retropepsin-like aspartic protease n=1 Tax=Aurantiacibacter suaedae TaxID=2545755 RepID=UPI0010F8F60A|nr:retropepsin-like aspartic protease [Aurantiacibacter suaedae]
MSLIAMASALAATIANPTPEAAAPPAVDREPTLAEIIAFETERYRRMTVPVTIRGEGPFRFLVDTGAEATVVARNVADQLELFDRNTATLVAMASQRQVETTALPTIALGSREFDLATAAILEAEHIGDADGILGLDSLQDQRVLFDFENSHIAVAHADELGGNRGFDIVVRARRKHGQLIVQRAEIDGVDVDVVIDTGAQSSFGNLALQNRLRRARALDNSEMTDVNGVTITGNTRLARTLQLERAAINNIVIAFTDSPTFAALGLNERPAMVLGMRELRLFKRVAVDFESRRVLFDLPDNTHIGNRALFP